LMSQEQMKAGLTTQLSQPLLFAAGHQQPPSPGCLRIFEGKVSLTDVPAGVNVDILHRTNDLQLEGEAERQRRKIDVLYAIKKTFWYCFLEEVRVHPHKHRDTHMV